ncbi:MAG: hypothetical protein JOZ68_09200 [Acidimicrobiia bacterium]|nr:hypothetical protein [Acidimicrobiia bacterium]
MEHPSQLPTPGTVAATKGSPVARGAIVGLIVGVAAAAAVVATSDGRTKHAIARPAEPDAGAQYIADWRRSQLGTWKVVLHWQRIVGSSRLDDEIRTAQRPPDRLSVALGSVDARRGDRRLSCASDADGHLHCRDAGAAPPYDQDVAGNEAVLRGQLLGPSRLYDVTATSSHCYDLRLRFSYPVPPYGRRARFCFDEATGAPTLRDIDRVEGRDVQEATSVSGDVTDADLAPPPGAGG